MTIQAGDILSYNGEKTTIATEPLKPYLENPQASKQRDWIYSEVFGPPIRANQVGYTIRNEKYKLIRFEQSGERLYRIDTDPSEETNLLDASLNAEAQENYDSLAQAVETLRLSTP